MIVCDRTVRLVAALALLASACEKARPGPSEPAVEITPPSARIPPGGAQTFAAVAAPQVTWSVKEGSAGGQITSSGLYTAPQTVGSYTVVAQTSSGASGQAAVLVTTGTVTHGISIPTSHPRLWFNPQRLAAAQAWFSSHPFTPAAGNWMQLAFAAQVTGNASQRASWCASAISHAMSYPVPAGSTSDSGSNESRWEGENMIVTYDWCFDQLTQTQRDALISNINTWANNCRQQSWGGLGMPENNFFWGNFRNELEWAIASYHENVASAEVFLTSALTNRWGAVTTHAAGSGKGGVFQEGDGYGRYFGSYATIPLQSVQLEGRDALAENDYFKSAVYYIIHSTTPALTYNSTHGYTGYELFPFNDDQSWKDGGTAEARISVSQPGSYIGDWMQTMASYYPSTSVGRHAQQWVNLVGAGPNVSYHVQPFQGGTTALSFSGLPLDYFASGIGFAFARKAWDTSSAIVHLQLGMPSGVGHQHSDFGNWQMWRGGRWVSRESVGYNDSWTGYGGSGTVMSSDSTPHNAILVNPDNQGCSPGSTCYGGGGAGINGDVNGPPVVKRLETQPGYFYADADLSAAYRNNVSSSNHPERDNPAAKHVEREYVFVRDLEALVIFDRLEANAVGSVPATSIKRTFLAHCEVAWTLDDGKTSTCTNGSQALRLTTLVPASSTRKAVTEGSGGQFRLEVTDAPGAGQSYFLHVLQGKDATAAALSPAVVDNGTSFTVTLDGTHAITFNKGMSSSGGSITISGTTTAFRTSTQGMNVTDAGPVWQ
jgi:hypothetical protein